MCYEAELNFFQKFVKNIRLNYHMITAKTSIPFPLFDLGLRNLLSFDEDYRTALDFFEKRSQENVIYKAADPFFCHYIFLPLPGMDAAQAMVIGPYTTANVSDRTIIDFMDAHSLPAQLLPHMVKYYSQLPILWEDGPLFAALEVLAERIWGSTDNYSIQTLEHHYPDGIMPLSTHYSTLYHDSISRELLELRYQTENRLLRAISQGQTQKAESILSQLSFRLVEPRTADSIRNLKNYLIISNTLMRKAAEQGSVHPIHIDHISGYFARKIELLSHQSDAEGLAREMTHKYCLLVKNHSLKAYSLPIQKVITSIDCDLTADLSLKAQAERLKVNPSYLSTLFKKETGTTLTDYVNQKRVEHAIFLLNSTSLQVQSIAQQCGIPDVNYFSKTFKKIVGKTPMEYRKNIMHPSLLS